MSDEIWLRLTEGDKRVEAVCANDLVAVQEVLRIAWLQLPSQVAKRNADIERVKAAAHAMSEGRLSDVTVTTPPPAAPTWNCGHPHPTRGEAIECLAKRNGVRLPAEISKAIERERSLRSPCADDCTHPSHRHAALD